MSDDHSHIDVEIVPLQPVSDEEIRQRADRWFRGCCPRRRLWGRFRELARGILWREVSSSRP